MKERFKILLDDYLNGSIDEKKFVSRFRKLDKEKRIKENKLEPYLNPILKSLLHKIIKMGEDISGLKYSGLVDLFQSECEKEEVEKLNKEGKYWISIRFENKSNSCGFELYTDMTTRDWGTDKIIKFEPDNILHFSFWTNSGSGNDDIGELNEPDILKSIFYHIWHQSHECKFQDLEKIWNDVEKIPLHKFNHKKMLKHIEENYETY